MAIKGDKLRIFRVTEEYVEYLRTFDDQVHKHDDKKNTTPYLGIVLNINGFDYYAPMTSPKAKHKHMNDSYDFIKIKNGSYGAINLNNMIPILKGELIEFDISTLTDEFKKNIFQNQAGFIRRNSKYIQDTAEILYNMIINDKINKEEKLVARCCNFKLLEEKSQLYYLSKATIASVAITSVVNVKEIEENIKI